MAKPNPIPGNKAWKPGTAPYADFLNSLTPEQKAAHLKQRRERKAMREVMKQTIDEYQAQWASELHNAAWSVLMRARREGDAQAFASVFDRIVGRPQEVRPDDGRALPWSDE